MSTLHRYLGVVVPLAVTISVLLGRRLPFTASEELVTQCIPAPVSPSHIIFAPEAAIVGIDCMTDVKIACCLCLTSHVREVVIEGCVATCDERHEDEEGAAYGEPVWQMAPHFCCTSQSASEGAEAVRDGMVRAVDACVR
eukprot:6177580-Pleurochrysis_carterae.AAC.2